MLYNVTTSKRKCICSFMKYIVRVAAICLQFGELPLLRSTEMGLCRSLLIMQDNYVVDVRETLSSFPSVWKCFKNKNMNFLFPYCSRNFKPRLAKNVWFDKLNYLPCISTRLCNLCCYLSLTRIVVFSFQFRFLIKLDAFHCLRLRT